ncbi:MAG: hypothetical protein K9W44_15010 [Candidatus Lokiarchaeota archaeon]|nr:hypothetical protein [Candidatus Harpocratesius repetitus]
MKEKIATRIIIQGIIQIVSALSYYFLLKNLAVEYIGIQGTVASAINLFSAIYFIGIDIVYIQYNNEPDFKDYFSNYLAIKLGLLILNFIPLIFYVIFFGSPDNVYFFIMIAATIFLRIADTFCLNLRANLKIIKGEIIEFISSLALSITRLIIALSAARFSNPLLILGLSSLFFYLLKFISSIVISKSELSFSKLEKEKIKILIKATVPLIFSTFIIFLTDNLGNFIISLSKSTVEFGYFFAINSYIIVIITSITLSLAVIFQAYYSKWLKHDRIADIQDFSFIMEKYTAIFYLLVIIVVNISGRLLMELFLPQYLPGLKYLYILSFLPLLSGINRPYIKLLYAGRQQKLMAKYYSITRIVYFLFLFIFIPENIGSISLLGFSAIGVCYLQILINIIDYFAYRYFCYKIFKIPMNYNIPLIFLLGIFVIGIYRLFVFQLNWIIVENTISIIITTLVILILYAVLLIFFKQITIRDYRIFKDLITIKNYKLSMISEFEKVS